MSDWYGSNIDFTKKVDFHSLNIKLPGFEVNTNGIFKIKVDNEGNVSFTQISQTPCVITASGNNVDNLGKKYYKLLIKNGKTETVIWQKMSNLMTKTGVLSIQRDADFQFQEADYAKITGYFTAFLGQYQGELPLEMVASVSGFKEKYTKFIIGNRIVTSDSVSEIVQVDNPTVEKMFPYEGRTSPEYVAALDPIVKLFPVRMKIYAAFTCLILNLTNTQNFIYDQCCDSGRLKTFTNRLVSSFFGDPAYLQLDPKSTRVGLGLLVQALSLIHISEPTRRTPISY